MYRYRFDPHEVELWRSGFWNVGSRRHAARPFTAAETAALVGIDRNYLIQLTKRGLPCDRVPTRGSEVRLYFDPDEAGQWYREHCTGTSQRRSNGVIAGYERTRERRVCSGWLTIADVARQISASRHAITDAIAAGLPHRRTPSGRKLVDASTLPGWRAEHRPHWGQKRVIYNPHPRGDVSGGTVYAMTDPRPFDPVNCPHGGMIRYIGKSENFRKRVQNYASDFKHDRAHNPALRRWFRKLKRSGLEPELKPLEVCLFGLCSAERQWIAKGRKDGWPLLNCTGGGEGTPGVEWTDDHRERASKATKDKFQDPQYVANWELSQAKRWGFETVEAWKADKAEKQRHRERNRQAQAEANRRADVRREAEKQDRELTVYPLTYRGAAFVPLTRGKWAVIDAEDWERVGRLKWSCQVKWSGGRTYYRAKRNGSKTNGAAASIILLNRFVMNAKAGEMVVYESGDQLDCRKDNLRVIQQIARQPRKTSALEEFKGRMASYRKNARTVVV